MTVWRSLDSISNSIFFNGSISDDYALSKLAFHYSIKKNDSIVNHFEKINIHKVSNENFYHFLNLDTLSLFPSGELTYYFEVWDNDQVNGNKSTKSALKFHKELSIEELRAKNNEKTLKITKTLSSILIGKALSK